MRTSQRPTRRSADPYGRPEVLTQLVAILNGEPSGNLNALPATVYQRYIVERTRAAARHLHEQRGPVDPLVAHGKRVAELQAIYRHWRCEARPCTQCDAGWVLWTRGGRAAQFCARCTAARARSHGAVRQKNHRSREAEREQQAFERWKSKAQTKGVIFHPTYVLVPTGSPTLRYWPAAFAPPLTSLGQLLGSPKTRNLLRLKGLYP